MSISPDLADALDGHRLGAALAELEHSLDAAVEVPAWTAGDSTLLASLAQLTRTSARVEALRLEMLAEAESRGCARERGAISMSGWLSAVLGVRRATAQRQVAMATALRSLPEIRAALATGNLTIDAAEVITRTLDQIPASADETDRAKARTFLLEQAAILDPAALTRVGRHLLAVLDAGGDDELAASEDRAVRARELTLVTDPTDGVLHLRGWLDPETGSALRTALEPYAAPRPAADGTPDRRSTSQRNADALAELVSGVLDGGGLPTSGGERPHLTVTVPLELLQKAAAGSGQRHGPGGRSGRSEDLSDHDASLSAKRPGSTPSRHSPTTTVCGGETEWGVPLSAGALRRLACDARITPVVLGGASQPLDVGRTSYVVPAPMRRALVARDNGCAFPGCDRPPAWCHAHHIDHWADGYDTKLPNLVLVCGHHHRLLHSNAGWTVVINTDGQPEFIPPPWADPAQVPRQSTWRQQLARLTNDGHDPPGDTA